MSKILPSRIVTGNRWYIIFYQTNPVTGEYTRFRQSYDINRIKNHKERMKVAKQHLDEVNKKLPTGWPFIISEQKETVDITSALQIALTAKLSSDREKTRSTFKSRAGIFNDFLLDTDKENMDVKDFKKRYAYEFLDWAVKTRCIGDTTYNNYKSEMRSLFSEMVKRELITVNPFAGITKKRNIQKIRRAYSDYELQLIIKAASKHKYLLLAILMIYYTFLRPIELRRLKISHLNLKLGFIHTPGNISKNKRDEIVTIPDVFMEVLKTYELEKYPGYYYVFGKKFEPGDHQSSMHMIRNKFKKVIEELISQGLLEEDKGLQLYSFKDTGNMELVVNNVNMLDIMHQNRHTSLETTQKYLQKFHKINTGIKTFNKRLI